MGKLTLKNLKVQRKSFEVVIPQLTVESGTILGVMGKSGCGKSTLLNAIAGFETLMEGEVVFDNKVLSLLPAEKRKVAIVFQRPALFSHLTVIENVCFGLKIKNMSLNEQREKAKYWLSKLDIVQLAERYPFELSGGEAQRVALARSVVVEFPVLLLDEPFSALDAQLKSLARTAVKEIIKELKLATILVSHDLEDLEALADEFCIMESGKITGWGKKKL